MLYKKILIVSTLAALCTNYLSAKTKTVTLDELTGNWHLRIMDGMEVRKARAILDFDAKKMTINGFDACNRISGTLQINSETNMTSQLSSTKMAYRRPIHSYVSQRLHETVKEGFSITEDTRNGVDGITLKSSRHELFFGRMGK